MARSLTDDHGLYDERYFSARKYGRDLRRIAMYGLERKRIWARAKKPGNILDIGCGIGDFVLGFDDRWDKYGVEPSEYAREIASRAGVKMYGSVRELIPHSMDVVVIRGSLQHMNDPMVVLAEATYVLKRGGLLAILATPDADSLVYKLWGNLPALDWPRNWVIFGSKCLRNIIQRLSFEQIEVLHPYWSTPYATPLHDFANFLLSFIFGWRPFAFPGNQFELYGVKK